MPLVSAPERSNSDAAKRRVDMSNDMPPPGPPNEQPGQSPYGSQGQPPYGAPGQPPNGSPYGSPYGQPQQPAGRPSGGAGFDPGSVNKLDWVILGVGAVVFVFSFFDYYSWDFGSQLGIDLGSYSWSAWHFDHGLFIAWFAMVFSVLGAAVLAAQLFAPQVNLPKPGRMLTFSAFAVSFVLYLLAIFAHSDFGSAGGHGFSFWLSLVLAGVGAVASLARAQQTGTALPGPFNNLPRIGN